MGSQYDRHGNPWTDWRWAAVIAGALDIWRTTGYPHTQIRLNETEEPQTQMDQLDEPIRRMNRLQRMNRNGAHDGSRTNEYQARWSLTNNVWGDYAAARSKLFPRENRLDWDNQMTCLESIEWTDTDWLDESVRRIDWKNRLDE